MKKKTKDESEVTTRDQGKGPEKDHTSAGKRRAENSQKSTQLSLYNHECACGKKKSMIIKDEK